jgi:hypothetical protein
MQKNLMGHTGVEFPEQIDQIANPNQRAKNKSGLKTING